ncbi:MAG: Coenzyme F420 hydrogenase/dehydrogenase, beta subunit C-terminal domain [Kiritimatiellae bacterium]|nr:Coenzyme F420 hydrogenase/dehydrogenase, beta subunit C-terminal domain [Kiritimatiellia bacterium]MDD5522654.1 Coenzyme F420 hydrogenase/dehydrogenase, beta subunit C-terminal domain [Kiritimatiellia bacterium]
MTPSLSQLKQIVDQGLCHRCGSCAGICPTEVIEPDNDYWPSWKKNADKCTNCGFCVRVCPGHEFSFPETSKRLFGKETTVKEEHGYVIKTFLGYSTDKNIRSKSTSGGIATQLPIFLLKTGHITGTFTICSDRKHKWKPKAFIARTENEIRQGMLSKYPACSMNHLVQTLKKEPGPFLFTGLPCQIHGIRKMMALIPALEEKILLTVGLFCHSCLDHQALRDILGYYRIDENSLSRVIYRAGKLPGYIQAQMQDGNLVGLPYPNLPLSSYRPNAKECLTMFFKLYSPQRCRMCIDATSEFADISVSDPWIKGWQGTRKLFDGYNLIIVRTKKGLHILEEARNAGSIVLENFPDDYSPLSNSPMVRGKRARAFWNITKRRLKQQPVPEYGLAREFSVTEKLKAGIHAITYFAADNPSLRLRIVRFLLSPAGRIVVWLAFFRRRILQAFHERIKTLLRRQSDVDKLA